MQYRTKWGGKQLSTLPFIIGIIVWAGFVYPHGVFANVRAETQPANPPLYREQEQLNASLNIYMPLIMFNVGSPATEPTINSQATAVGFLSTPPNNNVQANEIVASLNIYTPLVFH